MNTQRPILWIRYGFAAGLAGLALVISLNYQNIADQYALHTFTPSSNMAAIEAHLGITDKARAIFYRAKPQVNGKTSFNVHCNTQPHELELGCYYRGRIYVLQIDNASLASEMDVVTAHELLHAAWNEMSTGERRTLTTELERVYKGINDPELKERMAGYAKTEPGEEANELHSILGTEYPNLSPLLDAHYAKYFVARSVVLADHAAYQNVFSARRSELELELAAIRQKKGQLGVLNRRMDGLKTAGQITQYNALVPTQNALVDDINNQISAYQSGVDEYNALSKSLDSTEITDTEAAAQ